jgi:hypothetical protein
MKYEKPEIVLLGSAVAEILDPSNKLEMDATDGPYGSINAYAADE